MMCYKDQSFCKSDCENTRCFRNMYWVYTDEKAKAYFKENPWMPVSVADFSKDCKEYENNQQIDG